MKPVRYSQSLGMSRRDFGKVLANIGLIGAGGLALGRSNVAAANPVTARLGFFPSANPQNYSRATGSMQKAFGDKGKAEYVGVSAGPQIMTAMAGNSMDVSNVGSSPMIVAWTQGLPVSMVYVHKVVKDSEVLVVRKDAGITKVADLKGKRVGCPFNTSVHFALLSAMKAVGLGNADVRLINLRADGILPAWSRKEIDAAYIWYPVVPTLLKEGGEIIFESAELMKSGATVFDGIVVRDGFKQQHPELLLAYLKELDRINTIYRDNPESVADTMAPFLQIPREIALSVVKTTHPITPREMLTDAWMGAPGAKDSGILKAVVAQANFLKDAGQIQTVLPDYSKFVDSSFVARMV